MIVLMTGGSGCVGQALSRELAQAGHDVVLAGRTAGHVSRDRFVACDLATPFDCAAFPVRVDAVIHLAQSRQYRDFPRSAADVFAINVAASQRLADYALKAGATSFLYASTGSVYFPAANPVSEVATTSGSSFYAASKLAAELIVAGYASALAVGILRLFYVFGPGQSKMLIDGLYDRIRQGNHVTLQGDGGIRVTPTFSSDVARVFQAAAEQAWTGIFNVASPQIYTLRQIAEEIGNVVDVAPKFEQLDGQRPLTALPQLDKLAAVFDIKSFTELRRALELTFSGSEPR